MELWGGVFPKNCLVLRGKFEKLEDFKETRSIKIRVSVELFFLENWAKFEK